MLRSLRCSSALTTAVDVDEELELETEVFVKGILLGLDTCSELLEEGIDEFSSCTENATSAILTAVEIDMDEGVSVLFVVTGLLLVSLSSLLF